MESIVSLDSNYFDPILQKAEITLKKMGLSPSFYGEGLLINLVKSKLNPDFATHFGPFTTSILVDKPTSSCEWVDEYFRDSISEEYQVSSAPGSTYDVVQLTNPASPLNNWNFFLYRKVTDVKPETLPKAHQIFYSDGKLTVTETLLQLLRGEKTLSKPHSGAVTESLYSSVFSFVPSSEADIKENIRQFTSTKTKTNYDWVAYPNQVQADNVYATAGQIYHVPTQTMFQEVEIAPSPEPYNEEESDNPW